MARPKKEWLRLYVEVIYDDKIRDLSFAGRWVWVSVLCLARKSPTPGTLIKANGKPVTTKDLADAAKATEKDVKTALIEFTDTQMIHFDGDTIVVTNWHKRQFESDDVTSRANASRDRKKTGDDQTDQLSNGLGNVANPDECNVAKHHDSNVASNGHSNVASRAGLTRDSRNRVSESQSPREERIANGDSLGESVPSESSRAPVGFSPPSSQQVDAKFSELGRPELAKAFWNYYTGTAWSGVSSWQHKAALWINREDEQFGSRSRASPQGAKPASIATTPGGDRYAHLPPNPTPSTPPRQEGT